jgi:hypothetical protein
MINYPQAYRKWALKIVKKKQLKWVVTKKNLSPSGRVIIVHICAPHYHLFNPRLLRAFSAFRAAWRFGKIQRRPAAAAASAAAGAGSGVLLWRKPGNHGKINWKASGRSGDSAQLVGFKSFGIIISAWHRIKNVENEPKLENSKQKQTWAEKHLRTFKHPQDPSVWFSLAPPPPKKNTKTHIKKTWKNLVG